MYQEQDAFGKCHFVLLMQTALNEGIYVKNLMQCLAHFKCPIKVSCYHGIYLPINKGSLVTAVNFAPWFSKGAPFLPPDFGAKLGLNNQVLSRKQLKLECTYVNLSVCWGHFALLKERCRAKRQDWGSIPPLWARDNHWVTSSLVRWPSNSLRNWMESEPISSASINSTT